MKPIINDSIATLAPHQGPGVETLFQSKGFFWLTTAVATGLAAEEIVRFCGTARLTPTQEMIALFNQCVRKNKISQTEEAQAMTWSIENLQQIDYWNRQTLVFGERRSLGISKGFTAYWLNYKLIELEWQQVLGLEEMAETYQFLDQVLADSAELDRIEQASDIGHINENQRLFLRSHWESSKLFWSNLYASLQLFSLGLIEMQQPPTRLYNADVIGEACAGKDR